MSYLKLMDWRAHSGVGLLNIPVVTLFSVQLDLAYL